jgi:serine/threonine protein kinase
MHTGLQIPAYPAISDSAKDFIRRCLQVDDKRRWKISEMVSHCIINDSPEERLPMRNITNSKDIRSQSQGIKDCAPRINRNDVMLGINLFFKERTKKGRIS